MRTIKYTKKDGKSSERFVHIISEPGDCYLAIDFSEYNEEEREIYESQFLELHDEYLQAIKDIGLGSNYRWFKGEGLEFLDQEEE